MFFLRHSKASKSRERTRKLSSARGDATRRGKRGFLAFLHCIPKARFIRRTLHEPNLIIWFGACKDRRMNQLGSTDLYLGRPAVLFDCASRIER